MTESPLREKRKAALATPTALGQDARRDISAALTALLADVFTLWVKTKNFHWHVSGPHFRDYHLLFDGQAETLGEMIDPVAERVRKLGGTTIRSVGQIAAQARIPGNDADFVTPSDMLAELRSDNADLESRMRVLHGMCDDYGDVATASVLETWIDETETRIWMLFEAGRHSA
ncbi:DNA starvation/stationary phase protection protein (plasmid) [Paroceanicella profunda]|uniref:DNA starvation/stationary phase protection protein n=1 Tax=Paroceanicella profunda TaxID=2579971 RepID=A0A5B8FZJ8_9RHOB|nr:DNA starvation/stationary phase protection protein [Paroceanicella profunda]QDL94336.1 DNA starvation/stationary phase protection protein [Paroceanicella profunda]